MNSAFILINRLICWGFQNGSIGPGGPGSPDGPGGPGGVQMARVVWGALNDILVSKPVSKPKMSHS